MYEVCTKDIIEAQNKSEEAMEKIVENNSGLVWSIVNRFLGRGYPKEDLYQIGCIGLIKSIQRFDTSYDVKISTYAVPYIVGEIKKFIRDDGLVKVSRSIKELNVKIKQIQEEYLRKKGEEISISGIAKILNVSKQEVIVALDAMKPLESIDEEAYQNDSQVKETKVSKISNNKDEANSVINKLLLQELLQELSDKEKQIIKLRYYQEKTQIEVARILGISQVQVSRIEKKILLNMRSKL